MNSNTKSHAELRERYAGHTPGPWRYAAGRVKADGRGPRAGLIANVAISFKGSAERDANARLIAAAPDYAEACGLTLDPAENEVCGPLSWLRSAIDTLREDAVREAASGDDDDAYWFMLNEVEALHARLTAASNKVRGEVVSGMTRSPLTTALRRAGEKARALLGDTK